MNKTDEMYMRRCIQLAQNGQVNAAPNPMVGAVVVCDGRIIGEGYHVRCGEGHAEVNAIRSVKDPALLRRSTIYVSLEPCSHYGKTPPCADLILEKQIPRIVVGCSDPFEKVAGRGIQKLRDAGREVVVGVLETECRQLIRRFVTFHTLGRPYVTLKWAESVDGYIDVCRTGGKPVMLSDWFTAMLVHKKRAEHSAIMIGTRTALLDNPSLSVRHWYGGAPVRVVLDRKGMLPFGLHLFDGTISTLVFTDASCFPLVNSDLHASLEYVPLDYGQDVLLQVLNALYVRGLQSLLVEGGSVLLQSFMDAGLWDEICVEQSPILLQSGVKAPEIARGIPCRIESVAGRFFRHYEALKNT